MTRSISKKPILSSATPDIPVPKDYPHDQWSEEIGSDYYVPIGLRPYYSEAEPTDLEKAGYVKFGVSITETGTREITRVVSPGGPDREAVVSLETVPVNNLVDIEGFEGWPTFLHLKRLEHAQHAQRSALAQTARMAFWQTCTVCGTREPGVSTETVTGTRLALTGCTTHLPLLVHAARTALAAAAADQLLDDGRSVGDVVDQVVTEQLAELLDPEPSGAA